MRPALAAILLLASAPVFAETAPAPAAGTVVARTGQMLRDSANVRIGAVDSVKPDGSVGVIVDGRYVVIPANSLSIVDGKLVTSFTKKAVVGAN